jgi:hypothetical protein
MLSTSPSASTTSSASPTYTSHQAAAGIGSSSGASHPTNSSDPQQVRQAAPGKVVSEVTQPASLPVDTVIYSRYINLTCYNYGEPGHFVGICDKAKVCFICAIPGHYMTDCPKWKESQLVSMYCGSAGNGLGLFHIQLPEEQTTRWLNIKNCGVVVVKKGMISLKELEHELSKIFCSTWP